MKALVQPEASSHPICRGRRQPLRGEDFLRGVLAAPVLALALLATGAQAQTIYSIGDVCKFDIQQYCKNITARRIRDLKACLAMHDKDLFPRCHENYKDAK